MLNSLDVLIIGLSLALLIYGCAGKIARWRVGEPEIREGNRGKRFAAMFASVVGHDRIMEEAWPGYMHLFLFFGFFTPFVFVVFAQLHIATLSPGAAGVISLVLDLIGALALVGLLMAYHRRYGVEPDRLDERGGEDSLILIWLLFIFVSGFVVEGLRLAVTTPEGTWFAPIGSLIALALSPFSSEISAQTITWVWRLHFYAIILLIGTAPYTKLFHVIVGTLNNYYRSDKPKGVVSLLDIENSETFGVAHVHQFTWKQLMDSDACIRCGRCQDNCPAYLTDKPLTPKKMVQDIRDCLYDKSAIITKCKADGEDITWGLPDEEKVLCGGYLTENEIWACTTCRACMEVCPMYVEHIDKVVDLRRNLVLMESSFPAEVQLVFKNFENNSNPWGLGWADRGNWAKGLGVTTMAENSDVEYLLWVGCSGSFDDRYKKVTNSLVKVLKAAGVSFSILGKEEKCCGDSARKLGNEYLYQTLAMENIETLNGYGVKNIIVMCPHGYNTLKKDYQQLGGNFNVLHHTEFIAQLLAEGRLDLKRPLAAKAVYHDSCYLGRYNDVYAQPREILGEIPGMDLVEMDRSHKRGFCCGAGGGRMWMEEDIGTKINDNRVAQALEKEPEIAVTACPFCMVMFEDGLKFHNRENDVKVKDVVELVAEALEVGDV
ncbi:MAG: heterodisulfide reductase-related iron-sulfur binding cluster [Pseudomonadota bacterium]|nr:heterodisulfide reductase-related iron-sulfur binding cluster [Pseudomonadota bacterium]